MAEIQTDNNAFIQQSIQGERGGERWFIYTKIFKLHGREMVSFYKEILVKVQEDDRGLSFTKSFLLNGRRMRDGFVL